MDVSDCVKVYDIFCRVGKQFDELELFHVWSKSIGIARSSEYPEIERVTPKKLDVMEQFIKEKSASAQTNKPEAIEYNKEEEEEEKEEEEAKEPEPEPEPEEDLNATKALPAPDEEAVQEAKEEKVVQTEGDLLNLEDEIMTSEAHGDKLALALFDGEATGTGSTSTKALPWHAFDQGAADWETALVQSTTNLANQKPTYGGGFDTLLLDGMYKQGEMNAAMQGQGYGASGSASSVALGSAGRPAMLALPPPPTSSSSSSSSSSNNNNSDPFAASLSIAPPSYVQMSEMEKKQRLLLEEQMMWQQYAKDGMQGQASLAKLHSNKNNSYPQNYTNYYR